MEKYNSNSIEILMKSPKSVITDAGNQFFQFKYFSIDEIKELIKKHGLKTLEDYLINNGMDYYKEDPSNIIKRINEFNPKVIGEYNNLIERLKSPTLTKEEFLNILEDSKNLI
jgi:hypothetical protein